VQLTGADTRVESLNQAIAYGRAHGVSSRENRLPPDMFEEALGVILDGWKGSDPAWLLAAESAAREAYRGEGAE
jgi:hypothetical protein